MFHNGFMTNYKELFSELFPSKDPSKINITDSELIAMLIGKQLDGGVNLKTAIKTIIENKMIGTWKLVVMEVNKPSQMYVTKNVGPMFIGKSNNSVIIGSDKDIYSDLSKTYTIKKMVNNTLYEIKDDCSIIETKMQKKINVERQPKPGYNHIFQEEIF